jgi:TonB family protein
VRISATASRIAGHRIGLHGELSRDGKAIGPIDMDLVDGSAPDAAAKLPAGVSAGVLLQAGARTVPVGEPVPTAATAEAPAPFLTKITEQDVMTPPTYPPAALAQKLRGKVMIELVVDAAGDVGEVRVVSADPPGVFDAAAIAAAKQWHFGANARDSQGKRPSGRMRTQVDFSPDGPPPG